MDLEKMKSAITVEKAISLCINNNTKSYIWFVAKNKTGCVFEIGGTSNALIASIPRYENGNFVLYSNGCVVTDYQVCTGDTWIHPNDGVMVDMSKFLRFVKTIDYRKKQPTIEYVTRTEVTTERRIRI